MDFNGRVGIVTGGTRGIGAAISTALLSSKCKVAINYRRNDENATLFKEGLAAKGFVEGIDFIVVKTDVSDFDSARSMVKTVVDHFGKLDILVNNAGIAKDRTTKKMTEEEWDDVINNDLKTVFNCSRNVLETMISNNYGRIISLSSIVGETGNFGQANYSAAKAGVIGFTKSLALELAQRGITVNAIAPGFTETNMTLAMPEDVLNNVISRIPMRRLAKPEEIAYVAMFLLSENASYITGQVININGGLYM